LILPSCQVAKFQAAKCQLSCQAAKLLATSLASSSASVDAT
jgi:hypothetical protein